MHHTAKAAQEMHRISTGNILLEILPRKDAHRNWAECRRSKRRSFGELPRKFPDSSGISAHDQAGFLGQNEIRNHARSIFRISAAAAQHGVGIAEVQE